MAADASGRPLAIAEPAAMLVWEPAVRRDAEECAGLGYLDLVNNVMLLRDRRDSPQMERAA